MLSKTDLQQLEKKGISKVEFYRKLENFSKGFPKLEILKPAVIGDGIMDVKHETSYFTDYYSANRPEKKILKFVPASGAASRMFKDLFQFLVHKNTEKIDAFCQGLTKYPFYLDLKNVLKKNGFSIEKLIEHNQYDVIVDFLINDKGLNYGNLPKGLLKFHRYDSSIRMAIEEQIIEGIEYAMDTSKTVHLHFTVSNDHQEMFNQELSRLKDLYYQEQGIQLNYELSVQKPSTDIVAVDNQNKPVRQEDGRFLFAPAGHGALIENLNELDADIVFIKNIDNVVPDWLKPDTALYKRVLGGVLLEVQEKIHQILLRLDQENISKGQLEEVTDFLKKDLNIPLNQAFQTLSPEAQIAKIAALLNRPVRVCGMVLNTGEPGGGPFWITDSSGQDSLQILEKAQFDLTDPSQEKIFQQSTHFNPVDLVCGIKDYKGQPFDLREFTDPDMGFISDKVYAGKPIRIQELPGLWNGAMARWITIFVEVPLSTFNPVKNHVDWLRKEHQPLH